MMSESNEIYRRAAEWSAQVDVEGFSAEQQSKLDAWLDEDPRHLGAYLVARAALAHVQRFGEAAQKTKPESAVQSLLPTQRPVARRRWVLVGSIAASLVAVVLCGAAWRATSYEAIYTTAIGETKVVSLRDGSTITMNTGTSVSAHYNLIGRNITLHQGEALFDVAKNKARPFLVTTGRSQVRAVGTSFEVTRLTDRPLLVMVRDGVVEVTASGHSGAVSAGARAVVGADGQISVERLPADQIAKDLAWRDGYIIFRRQSLGDAAREFGRYSKIRIVIDDPALARRTVTGRYVATDPVGFAKAVAIFWNLKVAVDPRRVRLAQKTD